MLFKLEGAVQHYQWGTHAPESLVARYAPGPVDPGIPCAELWYGAHKKAPSMLDTGILLDEAIAKDSQKLLGQRVASQFENELPFMVKFLSINPQYGLSIQLHPSTEQAQKLRKIKPDLYGDSRGKPEIAVALSPVQLLHGLKTDEEIERIFSSPALSVFRAKSVRQSIQNILLADDRTRIGCIRELRDFITKSFSSSAQSSFAHLVQSYGEADPGLLFFSVMNFVELQPGESIFTSPGTLHAYLSGDLLEVLANSDNVVRAGLTPKMKDAETLLDLLNIRSTHSGLISPNTLQHIKDLPVPAKEFKTSLLKEYSGEIALQTYGGPMMVVVLSGEVALNTGNEFGEKQKVVKLNPGEAGFIGASENVVWARCVDASLCVVRA